MSRPVLHDGQGFRRRDALLARRRCLVQRPRADSLFLQARHQHRPRRERYLRRRKPVARCRTSGLIASIVDGQPTCDSTEPWLTQARALVSYTVPKVDVLVSAIFRSQPNAQPATRRLGTNGGSRTANYQMTPAQFLAATGVPLRAGLAHAERQSAGCPAPSTATASTSSICVFAKVLRFSSKRLNVGFDLYNLFNANPGRRSKRCTTWRPTARAGCSRQPS